MKKLLLGVVGTLAMMAIPLASANAETITTVSDVSGHVSQNGKDVDGASVDASCTVSGQTATGTDTTGPNGDYNIVLSPSGLCTANDTVVVTATKGGSSGQNSGTLDSYNTGDPNLKLNIALVNVSLPELGLATAAGAAIIGGGAFMVIRRRNLSGKAQ